jgi:hypothetical protein
VYVVHILFAGALLLEETIMQLDADQMPKFPKRAKLDRGPAPADMENWIELARYGS